MVHADERQVRSGAPHAAALCTRLESAAAIPPARMHHGDVPVPSPPLQALPTCRYWKPLFCSRLKWSAAAASLPLSAFSARARSAGVALPSGRPSSCKGATGIQSVLFEQVPGQLASGAGQGQHLPTT